MPAASLQDFHWRLHRWYGAHGRHDLPWRNTSDPYAVYLSEIMLQQTQVATVRERYYSQFLKRFPTLAALAEASEREVLKAWEGLGYYNRAINLHKAAKTLTLPLSRMREREASVLRSRERAALPDTIEELLKLPGIGRNTAHAVAAFAFRRPVAVMEANVRRVLARVFALKHPSMEELWEKAAALLDAKNPFDYNQAMMDIGALICTRRAPKCGECPAEKICAGKKSPQAYPAARQKKAVPVRRKNIVLLRNREGKYFATPRKTQFLKGLYHFMETNYFPPPIGGRPGGGRWMRNLPTNAPSLTLPLRGREYVRLGSIRQQYSHFTLEADIYLAPGEGSGGDWHTVTQLKYLPISAAEKKILQLLSLHCEEARPTKQSSLDRFAALAMTNA